MAAADRVSERFRRVMLRHIALLVFGLWPLASSATAPSVAGEVAISVPLRVYIVTGLSMRMGELDMRSWVTRHDVRDGILPEVNRIWRPAGIGFELEEIRYRPVAERPDNDALVARIVTAERGARGKADPGRIEALDRLLGREPAPRSRVDVYLVPFLGHTSQGHAQRAHRRVLLAQWTDKHSRGKRLPERFQLVEPRPFRHGSLSRTLAHELGHVLGLGHPDNASQREYGRLMGGRKPGYRLLPDEIAVARAVAWRIQAEGAAP